MVDEEVREVFFKTCMNMADDNGDESFCKSLKKKMDMGVEPNEVLVNMAGRFDEDKMRKAMEEV